MSGNEGGFKEFRIGDLFDIHPTKSYKLTNKGLFTPDGKNPVVANSSICNGIGGKSNLKVTERGNKVVFSDTTTSDSIFYQPSDFIGYPHVQGLYSNDVKWNQKSLHFFVTAFRKSSYGLFNYGIKFERKIASNMNVSLPTAKSGNIDFSYMEKYIENLERQQHHKIKTFLKSLGLDNCELTKKERDSLRKFNENQIEFNIFDIVEKFDVKNSQNNLKSEVVFESGKTPYVTASEGNNSVVSRISCADNLKESGNSIMIGGKTLIVTYQPEDFVSNDSHNLILYLKDSSKQTENIQLFCTCALYHFLKPIYSWGDSISKTKIQKDVFSLPITSQGDIDYDFMDTFISAQKKIVAQKLVCWLEQQKINDDILEIERNLPKEVLPMVAEKEYKR